MALRYNHIGGIRKIDDKELQEGATSRFTDLTECVVNYIRPTSPSDFINYSKSIFISNLVGFGVFRLL